jgi:hypothetical protein
MLSRLACFLLIGASLCPAQENAKIASPNPELIEGPWETVGASGIDGIFITTVTGSDWQTLSIRVYHRDGGKENWGYFATNEKATAQAYKLQDDHSFTLFDGEHLRIHFADVTDLKPFDLDLIFSSTSHEWLGTWSHSHQTYNVALRRPEPKSGVSPNSFVGDWMADSSNSYVRAGSLHIRQSSDGTLSAWLDRVIASTDRRNGEFLEVRTATATELDLERTGEPAGPAYRYHGSLSADGQMLTGKWAENYGSSLNAADKFRKGPD